MLVFIVCYAVYYIALQFDLIMPLPKDFMPEDLLPSELDLK
jgi:hypothetical protein